MITWIIALGLGVLTSLLYVGQYYGISVFFLSVLYIGAVYYYKKQAGIGIGKHFYLIAAYMTLLSPVFAVTTVHLVRFWSGFILVSLLLALTICEKDFRWPKWVLAMTTTFFAAIMRTGLFFTHGKSLSKDGRKQIAYVLIGLIVALPILSVALGLLASADAVMADYVQQAYDKLRIDNVAIWFQRGLVLVSVAAISFAYSQWYVERQMKEDQGVQLGKSVAFIPATVSATILFLLNIVYMIFAYIQVRFLFLGGQAVIPGVYDYAEYARSGFFELLALSILNTIGILVINRFTHVHLFNEISLTITALCTFIMIASSWFKMYLYEQAYGYTQLRLYVYIILAFMLVFMALITLGIWKKTYKVIEWSMVIGLAYFLIISYVNVDRIIVENNLARYEVQGQLDLYHLVYELSEDSVPSIIEAVEAGLIDLEAHGDYGYRDHLIAKVDLEDDKRKFFEFNWRHAQGLKAIRVLKD